MAYEKQTFVDGETILSAAHLIHMEEGIEAAHEQAATPGKDGEDGKDGATFTPSVSTSGVLSWTNNRGLSNPASVNIKGDKGDTGDTGATGPAGKDGADGKTPVKGTDYFTDAEVEEIVNRVVAQVGTGGGGGSNIPSAAGVLF